MPKFMTYQRPAPVNKSNWGGKPGTTWGRPGKQAPKPAPEVRITNLDIRLPLLKSR
jgi:hypothetical protein